MKVKSESEVSQSCLTLSDPMETPTRLLHPWDFPGKRTGVQYIKIPIPPHSFKHLL